MDPGSREVALDAFLNGGIIITPRSQLSTVLTGSSGIKVEAISTEKADGITLAPNNSTEAGTPGDIFTKNETTVMYINVTVLPVSDLSLLLNGKTLVQENNNVCNPDPDLIIAIGTKIGLRLSRNPSAAKLSGLITLSTQGLIIDATTTDSDETATPSFQDTLVTAIPVADAILRPTQRGRSRR